MLQKVMKKRNLHDSQIMEAYPDFKELFKLFNENEIEYLIVGASGRKKDLADLEVLGEE